VANDEIDGAVKCMNDTMRSVGWIMEEEMIDIRKARGGFQINVGEDEERQ
jgi:hypothetical protein